MEFKQEFDSRLREIENAVKAREQDSHHILKSIDELQSVVKSRLDTLTTFDQEKYDTELQRVRALVWKQNRAGRFRFKSSPTSLKSSAAKQKPDGPSGSAANPSTKSSIRVVYRETQSNLSLRNYEDSAIVAQDVTSSVYIDSCTRSKVYASCHQCRIHNCQDLEVYLEKCRNPVIESCSSITFVVPGDLGATVSDFSWMKPDVASPHFRVRQIDPRAWRPLAEYTEKDVEQSK